jgi:MFS family permease
MTLQEAKPREGTGYLSLIRLNPDFRNLWFGQIISLLGDWFNLIASATLINRLSESGLAISALFVIRMLAPFLISPVAGVLADRFNRRRLLIAADLLRAAVVLCFLFVRTAEQIWLLYTLTAIQLAISGIFYPARTSILPDIVTERNLGSANAISSATWSVMLALGSALGGLVAGNWGVYPAFIIDGLTFLLSAYFISRICYGRQPEAARQSASPTSSLRQYLYGLRYLKDHPQVLVITLHKAAFSLLISGPFQVVQVVLAKDIFVIGQDGGVGLGILFAAAGIGTGFGPFAARVFTGDRKWPMRIAIAIAYPLSAIGSLIIAPLSGFSIVLLGTTLRAVGGGINWVFSNQLLFQIVPADVRGRVFASEFAFFSLASALGSLSGGWGVDHPQLGIEGTLLWMAATILVPGILWSLWMVCQHRQEIRQA